MVEYASIALMLSFFRAMKEAMRMVAAAKAATT